MPLKYRGHIGGGLLDRVVDHHVVGQLPAGPGLLGALGQTAGDVALARTFTGLTSTQSGSRTR